ncbi:hypothetical protein L1987_78152 [Smallanthus sonchifolius]|uniref:Uncharacterized protein n=1 Tax=Smallanthus sonchifolius TaxID=185202 RepID=A0ACB8ZCX4_9ASTR|nr:hypothetical protein L1987_78152 [Smallanthus sonchifolius]
MKNIRLRDFPSFIRTTDINDFLLNHVMTQSEALPRASAVVLNTFDALEQDSVNPLTTLNPKIFTVGPLHLMQHVHNERLKHVGSNIWKQDTSCVSWLDTKDSDSVVFVNFGSITIMTKEQLIEFGWGLANSKKDFFVDNQARHCRAQRCRVATGCSGVPVLCWPFFAEQQTNSRYCCVEWGIGMEIVTDVKREVVAAQVREMIDGKHGEVMKKNSIEWKKKAEEAVGVNGSSCLKFDKLVDLLLNK